MRWCSLCGKEFTAREKARGLQRCSNQGGCQLRQIRGSGPPFKALASLPRPTYRELVLAGLGNLFNKRGFYDGAVSASEAQMLLVTGLWPKKPSRRGLVRFGR